MKLIIALLCMLPLAACATAQYPTAYAYKPIDKHHRGCVNHDLNDFHGSSAQQC